jgi:hypothetical protein
MQRKGRHAGAAAVPPLLRITQTIVVMQNCRIGSSGARGRNRTTDTRIFKTCVFNKSLNTYDKKEQNYGV